MNSSARKLTNLSRMGQQVFLPRWKSLLESHHEFDAVHWDHEPDDRAVASWTAPVLWRFGLACLHCQSARRLAHSKSWRGQRRFMERPVSFFACIRNMKP